MKSLGKRAPIAAVFAVALALALGAHGHGQVPAAKPGGGGGGKPVPVSHTALQTPPIQLGTSGGNATDLANGYCCSGTLGALVTDGSKYYILSNTHVFAHDSAAPDVAQVGDEITQPGMVDTSCGTKAHNTVATLSAWAHLDDAGFANVDAALAEVVPSMVRTDGSILEIGTIGSTPVTAALNQKVKKSGRTTGLTASTVSALNATVTVQYDSECAGSTYTRGYTGQIIIANRGSKFLAGGDSGSLMVENVATNPNPVGLLYAGSNSVAIANPIQEVIDFFKVTFVGGVSAGAAEVLDAPSPAEVARAMRAQARWANALMKVPRGVGHGIGLEGGRVVVKVFVEEMNDAARRALPDHIDGVPVVIEAVGRIVAF